MTGLTMTGLTYDAGALLAAEADRSTIWVIHRRALARGVRPVVPAVVLAQVWRGGPQPLLSRLLRGCMVETFDERLGRAVGSALAAARTVDVAHHRGGRGTRRPGLR
jgi:hypothetical protein